MASVEQLLEESRKLQRLSEHNDRLFGKMLSAESRTLEPMSPRVRASIPRSHFHQGVSADDRRDFDEHVPRSATRSVPGLERHPAEALRQSHGRMQVNELASDVPRRPANRFGAGSQRPFESDDEKLNTMDPTMPQMYDANQPTLSFRTLAERCVPVDVQAQLKVNAFLQAFHPSDRLLAGLQLKLLYSYYRSQTEQQGGSMFPEDLVRLCRAAGLMDGPHAFSNPDIISIAVGVIETLNEGSIPADASLVGIDTAMDFRAFCVALSEIAAFRFSRAESAHVGQRTLFRRVLGPLALHVMASDLVPQAAVNIIHDQHEHLKELQELRGKSAHDDEALHGEYGSATTDGGADGQAAQYPSSNRVPGVVGGTEGLLDPLIGLAPDPFETSRSKVEREAYQQQRTQLSSVSILSPSRRGTERLGQQGRLAAPASFSIQSLQSSPLWRKRDDDDSDGEASEVNSTALAGTAVPVSPTKAVLRRKHPAPALVGLLTFSKDYLLECFDRYAVASRERNPTVCEEDLEGYMNQQIFQAFATDAALFTHLSAADLCKIFVNNCSSKTLTDGNLVDGLSFTQFVSSIVEIAESVYVNLHGCDKYDAMLMVFYWLDMHNGLFGGQARLLLSQRFPLHNAAHCFQSLKVWNMFDFYCSFGNRSNHGLSAQLSSVKCLKLMREHGLIGEEGASDESKRRPRRDRDPTCGEPELVSVTRVDIIFQKVIVAEQKRKAREEKERARTSSRKRSGGDGLVKDYFTGATASRTNDPKRVNFSRKLEFRGFCIFLVEVALFMYPTLHPTDAYNRLLETYFFGDDSSSRHHGADSEADAQARTARANDDQAVAQLEKQLLQQDNSMNISAITAMRGPDGTTTGAGDAGGGGGMADAQLIGVIDQFQSLQRMTMLKHVVSRCHDNRLRFAFNQWRSSQAQASAESNLSILQDEIAALHRKLAQSKREVGNWKRKVLLGDVD